MPRKCVTGRRKDRPLKSKYISSQDNTDTHPHHNDFHSNDWKVKQTLHDYWSRRQLHILSSVSIYSPCPQRHPRQLLIAHPHVRFLILQTLGSLHVWEWDLGWLQMVVCVCSCISRFFQDSISCEGLHVVVVFVVFVVVVCDLHLHRKWNEK